MQPLILPAPFRRVLSVDFDGIFHGVDEGEEVFENGWMRIQGEGLFRWMPILEEILADDPDVALAAHTSWRNHHEDHELARFFTPALRPRFIGATPRGLSRDESILFLGQELGSPPMAALDDDPDCFPEGFPGLILCDPQLGIQDPHAARALRQWLESSRPRPSLRA